MKTWITFISVAALFNLGLTAAGAQPGNTPTAGTGSGAPAAGSGSAAGSDLLGSDQPSWLNGVQDVTAAETATPGKLILSMPRAVELAEKQHPTIREARAAAEAAVGRVDSAKVAEHPIVTLSAGATAGSLTYQCQQMDLAGSAFLAQCGGFTNVTYSLPLQAQARWLIYDFGATHANVAAAQASADSSEATVASTALDIRLSVESAYLQAVAYRRLVIVSQVTVKSEEGHLDQAKRFVQAQAKDPIEVAQAQSNLANAKSAEATAESNEAVALANLRAAIGWLDPTRQPIVDPNWPTPAATTPGELDQLVSTARKNRPDIVALEKAIEAAEDSVTAAHAERRPSLNASATVGYDPATGNWSPDPTWTAGVSLSWQLWDGGKSAADVHIANANVLNAVAQRDALLVSLTSAIEQSRSQILADQVNVTASTEAVRAAQEELKLAEARYAQGLGSQIELADAQTAVTTASGNLITAEWQLATAWATLARAIASA